MIAHDVFWYAFAGMAMLSSYLIFAVGFHWVVSVLRLFPAERPGERVATALLFGPIAGAWTFGAALRLWPSMPGGFYIAACLGIWLAAAFSGRRALRADIGHYAAIFSRQSGGREKSWTWVVLFLTSGIGLIWIAWVNMWVPPYANDPLEYLTVSRLIAGKLALTGVYPAIDTAVTSGFYGPWTHPPGFVLLLSWAQVLQGDAVAAGAAKFVNVYFLAAGAWAVFVYAGGSRRFRGAAAAALYTMTPLLLGETFEHHVDVVRVAAWTGAFLAVTSWARSPALSPSFALGLLFGLGNFVHSIGLVALPIFAVLALIVGAGPLASRMVNIFAAVMAALAVIFPDLMTNVLSFGRIIGDRNDLWDHVPLMVSEHLRYARGITTAFEILTQGVLAPFFKFLLFGFGPWLMLAFCTAFVFVRPPFRRESALQLARRAMRPTAFSVSALAWLGFFGITVLSVLAGSELIIKNARYAMTTIAFSSILAVDAGDMLFRLLSRRMKEKWRVKALSKTDGMQPSNSGAVPTGSRLRRLTAGLLLGAPVTAATLLGVAFILMVSFQSNRSIEYANIDPQTAGQADQVKAGLTDQPHLRMIARLNRKLSDGTWRPLGKVLTFRAGDVAYYGKFDYISYLSPDLLPAFKANSAREAGDILAQQGISHVSTPPYSMPEIYNSAIGALLADAGAAKIMDSDDGFTLYELLKSPEAPQMQPVGGDLAVSVAETRELAPPNGRAGNTSGATLNSSGSPARPADVDLDLYRQWSSSEDAYFISEPQITENGEHVFSARMSGKGFVLIELLRNGSAVNTLWEGLIPAEEKPVSSHFDLSQLDDLDSERTNGPENAYGISVRLKAGSDLLLTGAKLARVKGRESAETARVNLLSRLMLSGYGFALTRFPASKLEIEPTGKGLSVRNLDGRKLIVKFPLLITPESAFASQLHPTARLKGEVTLGGSGLREVSIMAQCSQFNAQSASAYEDTEIFWRRYLMTDPDRDYEFAADAPCNVKAARLSVEMWRPEVPFEAQLPAHSYRFGAARLSYGFTDEESVWQSRGMRPMATPK